MKQNNRQTLPLGRSTKKNYAGLSLLRPKLFTVVGDTYKYFNAIFQNIISKPIAKNISPFIARLRSKKFSHCKQKTFGPFSFSIRIDFKLKRPFYQPPFETRFFNRDLTPVNFSL